jgi:hypothetical protein
MRLILGFLLAFVIGEVCRLARIPRVPGHDFSGVVVDGPDDWLDRKCGAPEAMLASRETEPRPNIWSCRVRAWFANQPSYLTMILGPCRSVFPLLLSYVFGVAQSW